MAGYDNYYDDYRVRAGEEGKWYDSLDEAKKLAVVTVYDPETDEEREESVPFKYEVCSICDGSGSHVNPSIDCNGLTAEDFYEDPDFAESYMDGCYDVPCYGCGGNRVEPVIDEDRADPEVLKLLHDKAEADREYYATVRAERRMGA